ncbi:kinesin family member 3Cb isoform X2 [Engraulis encrasicolus]|uniref:kinesin family member 3Cb isoform X2 n=1 Tax=Engraulis encrasicolus TaxID=184585 RepID=UPI002FD63683
MSRKSSDNVLMRLRRMSMAKNSETVKVVVRCRPINKKEETMNQEKIVEVDVRLGQVAVRNPKALPGALMKTFAFDAVYDKASTQNDLYDYTCKPLVDSVLLGFNGTIFAYGQTGTGKTHTMQGLPSDPEKRGVIPNSFHHIFTHISRSQNQSYLVRVSYIEIYQEEIRDLLCKDNNKKLELKENPESGVYVKDLLSVVTKSIEELEHVMNLGNQSRSVGFTKMNECSSRSHAIFIVTVECSETGLDGEDHIRVGKLNMVDLAGSERQSKTGAKGKRFKEAAKINLSLSALGNVISALVDGTSTHVPYRDSKLTRLLQDSLGGNSKTVMIATIGPASSNYEETITTLRYANRAKNIKNKPRINEDPKDALLREFQEEIARLKAQLEERGMLAKERRRKRRDSMVRMKRSMSSGEVEKPYGGGVDVAETLYEEREGQGGGDATSEVKRRAEKLKYRNSVNGNLKELEMFRLPEEKEKTVEELQQEQEAMELIIEKYKSMESKLLVGGKNIVDHTNEQQKTLELRRQEIAEQMRKEREMEQQMWEQDEETEELRETFTTMQQEVELKTKKLKRLHARLQLVKTEIGDIIDEHVATRQELEQTQHELIREMKFKNLIIENFIPPEEKNKIMNRLQYDSEEDQWKMMPLIPSENSHCRVKRRPTSVAGYKRPLSQYAQSAAASGDPTRYRAENIMLLELDMSPPAMFHLNLNRTDLIGRDLLPDFVHLRRRDAATRVRKSQSWNPAPGMASNSSSACWPAPPGSPHFSGSQGACGSTQPAEEEET